MRWFRSLIAALIVLTSAHAATAQSHTDYLFTSDIHLNPMADGTLVDRLAAASPEQWDRIFDSGPQTLAPYGTDANAALFRLALAQMKAAVANPAVVFVSGDFLGHNYRAFWNATASNYSDQAFDAFVDKTIAYLALKFDATFPNAQFVITPGNNDSSCGDYAPAPNSAFLARFAQTWRALVNRGGRAPDFERDFSTFGDYTATLPNGTRIVSVDTNSWAPGAVLTCDPTGTARSESIAWFQRTVGASPAGAQTWVLEHIPPGNDPYAFLAKIPAYNFFATGILAKYRAARAADGAPPALIVAAHTHNDGFRIIDGSPMLMVPSISPLHGNNPAFLVAHVAGDAPAIADYDAYALALAAATPATPFVHEYAFNQSYGVRGFNVPSLTALEQKILTNTAGMRDIQAAHFVSGSPNQAITPATWKTYWCANTVLDYAAFATCAKP